MPVTFRKGPLPDDHPFKGTHIYFGVKRPEPSGGNITEGRGTSTGIESVHSKNSSSTEGKKLPNKE